MDNLEYLQLKNVLSELRDEILDNQHGISPERAVYQRLDTQWWALTDAIDYLRVQQEK